MHILLQDTSKHLRDASKIVWNAIPGTRTTCMTCIKCKKYVVRLSWDAGAGLAVCKVVSSVLPSRDALGAEQGLTKFIHPRLDEGIMLLHSWRCGFGCQEVQRSVFQGAAISVYPPKNRSFRRETISITYCIQKLTRHDGDSAKTGHWTHSHRKWVVEDVGTLHIYIYQ